jgi:hypothetical protein
MFLILEATTELTILTWKFAERRLPAGYTVSEHQNVHFGQQEAVKCFRRFA